MEKLFFEVFPTLELKSRTRELMEDTGVEKVSSTRNRDFLRIYIRSSHLIPKTYIWETEDAIKSQFFKDSNLTVKIYERFELSSQYNPEKLMDLYGESLLEEVNHHSFLIYNMLRTATFKYPTPQEMIVDAEDLFLYHEREQELLDILQKVFVERCGQSVSIKIEYHEAETADFEKEDSLRVQMRIQEISRRAGRFEEEPVFLGDTGSKTATKDKAEKTEKSAEKPQAPAPKQEKATEKGSTGPAGSSFSRGNFQKSAGGFTGRKSFGGRRDFAELKRSDNPDCLFGHDIEDDPIKIEEVVGEIGDVTICGKVLLVETRDIKNDRTIFMFDMSDYTDSIRVKMFIPTDKVGELSKDLKEGAFVKVKGIPMMDKFDHDLTIGSVAGIMKSADFTVKRSDNALHKRVELHCHTKMSDMDGVSEAKDIVKQAYKWGHRAIAITDHGVVQGFTDANHVWDDLWKAEKEKRKEAGDEHPDKQDFFKVLYGVEAYLVDDLHKIVTDDEGQSLDDDFVVFDIETTGLSPVSNQIIEFGAVKVSGGKVVDRFSTFVNPLTPIPYEIEKLTSIRDDDVKDADTIDVVMPRFLEFCRGCVLVAHNAEFDVNFVKEKCRLLGYPQKFTYVDTLPLARVQLPGHSKYTLDGVAKALGVELGHHHRAVDDAECTAWIFVKFLDQLRGEGMTHLSEVNIKEQNSPEAIAKLRPNHAIILAKNELGRIHLYHLVSESHLTYFNRFPKIPKSRVMEFREGLILGSACEAGELYSALVEGQTDEQIARAVEFYDYLEIQPVGNNAFMVDAANEKKLDNGEKLVEKRYKNINSIDDIREINKRVVELGKIFHKPVVATCDVHFLNPQDEVYRRIILAGKGFDDADRQPPLFLHSTDEMLEEFAYLGSDKAYEVVVTNSNMIADMCETLSPVRPDKCPPVIPDSDTTLTEICYNRAHELYGPDLPPIVTERLERELHSIISNGFAVMYIIAQKLVWKSVEDGYLVGSRGSVGSSFVATMAGITEVNPLSPHYYCSECHYVDFESDEVKAYAGKAGVDMPDKACPVCGAPLHKDGFDIPFETFLGFKGDKEPDIDLNFSGEYQSKAHKYTEVIFGSGQTFRAGTIATLADKTAFGYVKNYFEERGQHKRVPEINRIVQGCVGVRRSTGQHPGGIVVLPIGQDINSFTPVQHPANDMTTDTITTHFDYHSIDHNLLKLDILGHDDPTMIRMLQDLTGIDPVKDIPLDGKDVMSLFQNTSALGITPDDIGGTPLGALGIPEFGTDFAMQMLIDTKPQAFSDLVRIAGLAHGTDVWLGNAETLIKEGKATISTAICTRDDIMTYLISKGVESEKSFKIMEAVRKGVVAKGKSDKWPEWKQDMLDHDVPDWYVWSCEKIKYMFPKAHAAAYVMMAWRIAWCKIHYPQAYYAAFFSIRAKAFSYEIMCQGKEHLERILDEYKRRKKAASDKEAGATPLSNKEDDQLADMRVVQEMYARGFEFMPIDLTKVKARHFQVVEGKVMPALTSIEGLGPNVADSIVEAVKNGPFLSRDDFRERCKASQTITETMFRLGILGDIPESNQISIFDFM
jgi:DNA polymerase-3 subunit alpha (Gram-positive type)